MQQILDIEKGKLAIFTDIHGNWDVYERALEAAGAYNATPVFAGDLIHKVTPFYEDRSKEIIDDLAKRVETQECIALLGNHELAHIYEMPWIADEGFDSFEKAIKGNRQKYIEIFMSMPYAIRTKNAIINHAGTPHVPLIKLRISKKDLNENSKMRTIIEKTSSIDTKLILQGLVPIVGDINEIYDELDHRRILSENVEDYGQFSKEEMKKFGGVGQYIASTLDGALLDTLFSGQNDIDYPKNAQKAFIDYTLKLFSDKRPIDFLVSGHIHTQLFERLYNQLRFSTGSAIMSDRCFLVIEVDKEYSSMHELMYGLQKLSGDRKLYEQGKNELEENLNLLKSFLNPKEEQGLDIDKAEFTQERDVLYLGKIGGGYKIAFNGAHFIITSEVIVEE